MDVKDVLVFEEISHLLHSFSHLVPLSAATTRGILSQGSCELVNLGIIWRLRAHKSLLAQGLRGRLSDRGPRGCCIKDMTPPEKNGSGAFGLSGLSGRQRRPRG